MRVSGFLAALLVSFPCSGWAQSQSLPLPVETQIRVNAALQDALVWTGHYDGLSDGAIGEKSIGAIAAFQRQRGWPATGEFAPEQKIGLLQEALAIQRRFGFSVDVEPRTQVRVGLPLALVRYTGPTPNGARFTAPDGSIEIIITRHAHPRTLRELFDAVVSSPSIQTIAFKVLRRDTFFVAGEGASKDHYYTARLEQGGVRGLAIVTSSIRRPELGRVIVAVANSFHNAIAGYHAVAQLISTSGSTAVMAYEQRAPEAPSGKREGGLVPRSLLLPIVSSILAEAGVENYKILPPQSTDGADRVAWVYEDGSSAELLAARPRGLSLSEVANLSIQSSASGCNGEFASVRGQSRFFRGSEIMKVETRCRGASGIASASYSISELPSGVIVRIASFGVGRDNGQVQDEHKLERVENAAVMNAVLREAQ